MINNKTKLNHYNILNSIRTEYLKIKEPFSIPSNINITYREIKLKYLTGKNYFVEFSSTGQSRDQPHCNRFSIQRLRRPVPRSLFDHRLAIQSPRRIVSAAPLCRSRTWQQGASRHNTQRYHSRPCRRPR